MEYISCKQGEATVATLQDGCRAYIEDQRNYYLIAISDDEGPITKELRMKKPSDKVSEVRHEHITILWG